jgi:hypothetical protein
MKKLYSIVAILLLSVSGIFAQFPHAINFQAIARDANGDVMVSTPIQIRLTIIDGSATGTEVYQELRALTTNDYGSFSFQIGRNANYVTIGTFDAIDWNTVQKFLKIDYDPTNQFNWALTLGTIEFVAVPYALSAETVSFIDASNAQDGDVLVYNSVTGMFEPQQIAGTNYTAGTGISISGTTISNTGDLSNTNEIQTLSLSGNSLSISSGNSVTLPTGTTYTAGTGISISGTTISNTGDLSNTNEIQTLSLSNNSLSLSNGGGNVVMPTSKFAFASSTMNFQSTIRLEWLTNSELYVTAPSSGYYFIVGNGRMWSTEEGEWSKFRLFNVTQNQMIAYCSFGYQGINEIGATTSKILYLNQNDVVRMDYYVGGYGVSEFTYGGDPNGETNISIVKIAD